MTRPRASGNGLTPILGRPASVVDQLPHDNLPSAAFLRCGIVLSVRLVFVVPPPGGRGGPHGQAAAVRPTPPDAVEERTLRRLASARHAPASLIQRVRIITASWDGASVAEMRVETA